MKSSLCVACLLGALVTLGCKKEAPVSEQEKPGEPAPTAEVAAAGDPARKARQVFKSKCVVCHGESGKGDGPGAAALTPKPRNYTDAAWQKSVTDEQLKKTIVYGGAAVGKSAAMPANPDLRNQPQVVDELVKMIRSFAD